VRCVNIPKEIVGNEQVENGVIDLLKKTPMAVSCDYVAFHLKICWATARSLLLNMALEKKIEMEKTTKSAIFRLPKTKDA
jgi:hypothetical protein